MGNSFCKEALNTKKGLRPFQEYFTYVEPTVNQRSAKTGVPEEKPPDLLAQNLVPYLSGYKTGFLSL